MNELVTYTSAANVATITINRPDRMNALNENIAGAKRAEARKTAMDLRNYNAQRPQGTLEKTQLTPSTYV